MSRQARDLAAHLPDADAGVIIPRTEAERRARSAALLAALNELEAIPADASDAPEIWAEVFRGIDEGRPERPLFEGRS